MPFSWTLILLPGMHGTTCLLGPFLDALPADLPRRAIAYPTDRPLSYDELTRFVQDEVRDVKTDLVVVGESFSGPVALRLAAADPGRVRAVVLVGSYARPPWPSALRWLVYPWAFKLPMPRFLIRLLVAGWRLPGAYVDEVGRAIRRPTCDVLAFRTREALSADSTAALRACRAPILAVQGRQDHMVLPFNATRLRAARPDVRVLRVDGPHLLLQTIPQEMWDAIREFVNADRPGVGSDRVGTP